MKSSIDNSVTLGGKQVIKGAKKIANAGNSPFILNESNSQLDIQCTNIDVGVLPAETKYGGITFLDKNAQRIGKVETSFNSSGGARTSLSASRYTGSEYIYASLSAQVTADYKKIFSFGQSFSNSNPGYFKIPTANAGLYVLICWGYTTGVGGSGNAKTITYPLAYTSAPRVTLTGVLNTRRAYNPYITTGTTTSFGATNYGTETDWACYWIAIGFRQE